MIRIHIPTRQSLMDNASSHIDVKVSNIFLLESGNIIANVYGMESTGTPYNDSILSSFDITLEGELLDKLNSLISGVEVIVMSELVKRGLPSDKVQIV